MRVWGKSLIFRGNVPRFHIPSEMKRLMSLCPLWRASISSPGAEQESEYAYLLNCPFKGKGRGASASLVFVQSHGKVRGRPNQSTRGRRVSMTVWMEAAWVVHVWRCGSSGGGGGGTTGGGLATVGWFNARNFTEGWPSIILPKYRKSARHSFNFKLEILPNFALPRQLHVPLFHIWFW